MVTTACPPPECPDCYYWNGWSCVPCAACYKCIDGDCLACKCWDTGTPIVGSINVQNAKLCEQKTHTSSVSDTDHWFKPGVGEGHPADSLTYSWTASDGEPLTANTANFTWRAPPCVQVVTITLRADDVPNSMDDPCPGSSRDDEYEDFQGTSTVSLPDGCGYAGPHDSSVHWINPDDDYVSWTCTVFGEFQRYFATYDVDFKYDDCTWVCEISNVQAKTRIAVRAPNSLLPDGVSVESASDVPCVDANCAKVDLNDDDLSDDNGAPRCKYWCYSAAVAHEEKHRFDWQTFYGDELSHAIALSESCQSNIDCGDPNTISCQSAENYWQQWIGSAFAWAYINAAHEFNDPSTPLNEADQRAYEINYQIEQPISAALPEGCTP